MQVAVGYFCSAVTALWTIIQWLRLSTDGKRVNSFLTFHPFLCFASLVGKALPCFCSDSEREFVLARELAHVARTPIPSLTI